LIDVIGQKLSNFVTHISVNLLYSSLYQLSVDSFKIIGNPVEPQ